MRVEVTSFGRQIESRNEVYRLNNKHELQVGKDRYLNIIFVRGTKVAEGDY